MFTQMLERALNGTPGAVAVTLMGFDGIEIETINNGSADDVDAQSTAVELGHVASQLKRISEGIGTGEMNELTVQTGALTTVLRPLTDEYFVALALAPGGSTGKARYLLRVISPGLTKELV